MTKIENSTIASIAEALLISEDIEGTAIAGLSEVDHRYLKDLKINLNNALAYENLQKKEAYIIAASVATNEKNEMLIKAFEGLAKQQGATDHEMAEAYACVSLMNVNNVFYRFRHFINKDYYNQTPAGIKMSIMVNPVLGKEFFELLSLAISAVNGCELCVTSHEESVLKHGASTARVYDAVRLAAVIKGLAVLVK